MATANTGNRLGENLSLKMQQTQKQRDMKLRKQAFEHVLNSSSSEGRYDNNYRSSLGFIVFLLLLTFFISEFAKSAETAQPEEQQAQELEAARGMEMLLINNMIQEMRKTVPENEWMPPSHAEKVFQQMLDSEYAKTMSESGSIGIAELVVAQMRGKR